MRPPRTRPDRVDRRRYVVTIIPCSSSFEMTIGATQNHIRERKRHRPVRNDYGPPPRPDTRRRAHPSEP